MAKHILIVALVMAITLAMVCPVPADVPQLISFQGKLHDSEENPLNGEYQITFRIYNVESGGTHLWTETSTVSCENGLYNVILGLTNPITLGFEGDYWLGVQVTGDEEMSPRYRIVSVPTAFRAAVADSAHQVSWTNLTDVPAGFADGTDDVGEAGGVSQIDAGICLEVTNPTGPTATIAHAADASALPDAHHTKTTDASELTSGTLDNARFSAYSDLSTEGKIGTDADKLAAGDHNHDTVYVNEGQNNSITSGMIVDGSIQEDDVAFSIGDGDITAVTAGTGLTGGGTSGDVTVDIEVPLELSGPVSGSDAIIEGSNTGSGHGVIGSSTSNYGVYGTSSNGVGVAGECADGAGVAGYSSNGFAGYFDGKSYFSSDVGIGTTIPTEKLDVAGNIHASGIIESGSSITIDGGNDRVTSSGDLEVHVNSGRALKLESNATSPNLIGGFSGNSVVSGVVGAAIGGGGESGSENVVTDNYGTVGGGSENQAGNAGGHLNDADYATVSGGKRNKAINYYATVGGGMDNNADGFLATISGGSNNTVDYMYSTVGGGAGNIASGTGATVGGGLANEVTASYGTIAGGGESEYNNPDTRNHVTDNYGTIGGGGNNQAGNNNEVWSDATYATVGGGEDNTASGGHATVGGGMVNTASDQFSSIAGGAQNIASGYAATICGGVWNEASGECSFAAGRQAKANHDGCFVWSDNSGTDFSSDHDNQFSVLASGGVYFYTNTDFSKWIYVAGGGNSWNYGSDRAIKENFSTVDGKSILKKLASFPIQEYNLKGQTSSIRHMGPVAQDFYAAFGLGEGDKHISTADADGVALAAIQGLYELMQEKDAEIEQLKEEIQLLRKELSK